MSLRSLGLGMGGVLALAGLAVLWPDEARPPATGQAGPPKALAAAAPAPAPTPVPAAAPEAAAPPRAAPCAGPTLTLHRASADEQACLGPARLSQSGDIRTWRADAIPAGWQLEIDLAGEDVLSVRLQAPGRRPAACEGEACAGVSLGPRDGHGVRALRLAHTELAAGPERWRVDTTLALAPDADQAACTEAGVAVTGDGGAAWRFCVSAAAVARLDDGTLQYHLRSPEGEVLRVGLDAAGHLAEIALGGWRCRQWQCDAATLSTAADGRRSLSLDGVALLSPAHPRGGALRMQGGVTLPEA